MFIQSQDTPNPATKRFLPGELVYENNTANFVNKDEAANSPLAKRLFNIEGVIGVFLGHDFITVTKAKEEDWDVLNSMVIAAIMDHYQSSQPAVIEKKAATDSSDDDEVVAKIKELLETRIRPYVAMDGGDIVFDRFEDGIVYLHMQGACAGCPSSTVTLKSGVENLLKHYIPEIESVEQVINEDFDYID